MASWIKSCKWERVWKLTSVVEWKREKKERKIDRETKGKIEKAFNWLADREKKES